MSLATKTVTIILPVSPTAYPESKADILPAKDAEAESRALRELILIEGQVEIVSSSFTRAEMAIVNHEYVPTDGVRHCEALSYVFEVGFRTS